MKFETLPINARLLEPAEIARRFVPNEPLLGAISAQNHVILVGPRGSGKTTLLAMLTRPAQRVWAERHGSQKSEVGDSLGVLVRADLTWARQLRHLTQKLPPEDRRDLMLAVYANRASIAMARYTQDLVREFVEHAPDRSRLSIEHTIIDYLRAPCRLSAEVASLADFKLELSKRNARLWDGAEVGSLKALGPSDGIRQDLFAVASNLAEALSECGLTSRVVLLLDELELVPHEVRSYLKTGLRDADASVTLKMSLSPVENAFTDVAPVQTSGTELDDFIFVDLSFPLKSHGAQFTSDLLTDVARRRGVRVQSSGEWLGRSLFDAGTFEGSSAYGKSGSLVAAFKNLAARDPSFADYLQRMDIKLDDLATLSENHRAATVRKIRDIVLVREARRQIPRSGRTNTVTERRGGQNPLRLYAGNSSVLALLEGNPRWIVNFVSHATERRSSNRKIRPNDQVAALNHVLVGVLSRILAVPVPVDSDGSLDPERGRKILDLIDRIGRYFRQGIHGPDFTADPPLTFRCDAEVPDEVRGLVADGTAHGAFVFIPDKGATRWTPTINGRFRLAYLVAASFELPPTLGREVRLSTLLARSEDAPGFDASRLDDDDLVLFE